MLLTWDDFAPGGKAERLDGQQVEITGCFAALDPEDSYESFFLTAEPVCCFGCLPRHPGQSIEVFVRTAVRPQGNILRLSGVLRGYPHPDGWRFELHDAQALQPVQAAAQAGFTRRHAISAGAALGLSAWMPVAAAAATETELAAARSLLESFASIDIHSHAGSISGVRRIATNAPFSPVAEPMRDGRMAVICLTVTADSPVIRVGEDRRIRPVREPAAGELYDHAQRAFERAHAMVKAEGLRVIDSAADLRRASAAHPSVIIASEGADFLDGRIERVAEAYERWTLRHLQLTHYRVNELGDIQTEPAVHGGLTDFGAEVIRECNKRGIVVDIAHGTFDLVKRAAEVTTKPLVLSHSSLNRAPGPASRTISPDHARLVAQTGGVIGIWPPSSIFADMAALAAGIARMADAVGVDHVGVGTDMMGLTSASVLPDYQSLPALAAALRTHGFRPEDVRKILGGNYARVFTATMG